MKVSALRKFQLYVAVEGGYEYKKAFKDFNQVRDYLTKNKVNNYRVCQSLAVSELVK